MNVPELLEKRLKSWPKHQFLYLGSLCDPFNELEKRYGLTAECLKIIAANEVPLLITTSGVNDILMEEVSLLKSMKSRCIVVVELSRPGEVKKLMCGGVHQGVKNANRLYDTGLEVWTTVAPVCPGIIEPETFLPLLNENIPLYTDALRVKAGDIQADRVMAWIHEECPEMEDEYKKIVKDGDVSDYQKMMEKYKGNERIKTFPYDLT